MTKDYPLQYDGEFVLTKNGSKDFGEISQEIASEIHRQTGKIRLRRGIEIKGHKGNFGATHIEREKRRHLSELISSKIKRRSGLTKTAINR